MRTIQVYIDATLALAVLGVTAIGHTELRGMMIVQAERAPRLAQEGLPMPSAEITPGRLGTVTDRDMGAPPGSAVGSAPGAAVGAPPSGAVGTAPAGAVGAAPPVAPLPRSGAGR